MEQTKIGSVAKPLDKSMNEMFDGTPAPIRYDDAKVLALWPQTRGELQGYANHLAGRKMEITAEQIRMAVQLADKEFARLKENS